MSSKPYLLVTNGPTGSGKTRLHLPKRKMRQDYLFFIYLKAMF